MKKKTLTKWNCNNFIESDKNVHPKYSNGEGDEILYRRIIQDQDVGKPIKRSKGEKPKLEERSDNLKSAGDKISLER